MSIPWTVIVPEVGSSSAVKVLKVVDLPAPLIPSKAKHSPLLSPKERFSTAQRGLPGLQGPDPRKYTFLSLSTLIYKAWSAVACTRLASSTTSVSKLSILADLGNLFLEQLM